MNVSNWTRLQGNQENRVSVYDKKVIDYINFILRAGEIADCPIEKVGGEILCGSKSIRLTVPVYVPVSLYVCLAAWIPAYPCLATWLAALSLIHI